MTSLRPGCQRGEARQPVSSPTSARPTPSSTSCAASRTTTSIHVAGSVDPIREYRGRHRARPGRPGDRGGPATDTARPAEGDKGQDPAAVGLSRLLAQRSRHISARPGRRARTQQGRTGEPTAQICLDHRQAHHVRLPTSTRTASRTTCTSTPCVPAAAEGAEVVAMCAASRPRSPTSRDADKKEVSCRDHGPRRAWTDRLIRAGVRRSACRPASPPASRKCARGPS